MTARLDFGAAERYDMFLLPDRPGKYRLRFDFFHWVPRTTRKPLATRFVEVDAR